MEWEDILPDEDAAERRAAVTPLDDYISHRIALGEKLEVAAARVLSFGFGALVAVVGMDEAAHLVHGLVDHWLQLNRPN